MTTFRNIQKSLRLGGQIIWATIIAALLVVAVISILAMAYVFILILAVVISFVLLVFGIWHLFFGK